MTAQLERVTFSVPRDEGYTRVPVLEKLVGVDETEFGHAVLKELLDNGLDACENAGVPPEIEVTVSTAGGDSAVRWLTVADNGAGITAAVVTSLCDFATSTSDKAAYRSPARGAQGNAMPCVLCIPYALGVRPGTVVIEAIGTAHRITPELVLGSRLDIHHDRQPSTRAAGTQVSVPLPTWLKLDVSAWVQAYATVNPHATFTVNGLAAGFGVEPEIYKSAGHDAWRKWVPSRPTSPHWYDSDGLRDLISAHLAAGMDKPLGVFVREFDGLSSTAKARKVASFAPGVSHLSGFKKDPAAISALLSAMQCYTRPVKPAALGVVPGDHYRAMLDRLFGISRDRFWHARKECVHHGIPWAVDVAIAATERPGRVIFGTNFGVPFGDPLAERDLLASRWDSATGSASFLRQAGAYPDESNGYLRAAVVHVQCGAPRWTDPGKKNLSVPADVLGVIVSAFAQATKALRAERERARKDAAKEQRRQERENRVYWESRAREEREPSLKETVTGMLPATLGELRGEDNSPVTLRGLYDAVRQQAASYTSKDLTWRNFRQILDGYERDYGEIPGLVRAEELPEVDLSRHPRGPDELKAAARQLGLRSYTELLALHETNDPYAMGKPEHLKLGRWFAGAAGQVAKLMDHIRGIHYKWFTAQGRTPEGGSYQNDSYHWQKLSRASKIARVLGLADPEAFEDRRNGRLRVYSEPRREDAPRVSSAVTGDELGNPWSLPRFGLDSEMPELSIPGTEVTGYGYSAGDQPEVLVVITEKLEDVFEPVCRELGVDLLPGTGYESYTRAIQLLRYAEARCQKMHGWYVSDYDDAGGNMPIAVARQCQFFADQLGIKAEITLEPLALTREQVDRYQLPKSPVKEKQTELDALEALHPGELARMLRAAVEARRDATLKVRLEATATEAQHVAAQTWDAITDDVRAELEAIEAGARSVIGEHRESEERKAAEIWEATADLRRQMRVIEDEIRQRYAVADTRAEEAIGEANARLDQLAAQVRQRWETASFDLPARPEPEADVDDSGVLYDSRRHWLDQLAVFKAAKGAPSPDAIDGTETDAS